MRLIPTTYFELTQPLANDPIVAPRRDVIIANERLNYDVYMSLWCSIGGPLDWDGRLDISSDEVKAILSSARTEIFVVRWQGKAAGLCEFHKSEPKQMGSEIVYFGLVPAFQGRGLGPCLLDVAIRRYWTINSPPRIWLHTDTGDDPRALPLYRRFGFRIFATCDLPEMTTAEQYRAVALAELESRN